MFTILFVCSGNTCRSPIAEALMRQAVYDEDLASKIHVMSAGLAANAGDKISEPARQLLSCEGMDMKKHAAVNLNTEIIDLADLILVMTEKLKEQLLVRFPFAGQKTHLLKDYAGIAQYGDIEDPYGLSLREYRVILEDIRCCIQKITNKLEGGQINEGGFGQRSCRIQSEGTD